MCICIYVYMYICIYVYMYICIYVYIQIVHFVINIHSYALTSNMNRIIYIYNYIDIYIMVFVGYRQLSKVQFSTYMSDSTLDPNRSPGASISV